MKKLIRILSFIILLVCSFQLLAFKFLTSDSADQETVSALTHSNEEDIEVESNIIRNLMENIGCGERTAASIYEILLEVGISEIHEILKTEDDAYTILKVTDSRSKIYYVFIGIGYFLEEIRADSLDGQQLYYAIQ